MANPTLQRPSIKDTSREQLQTIQSTRTHPDPKVLNDLKKRKLITMHKVISYSFSKGPKFARQFVKEETDLTAEMLARYENSSLCQSVPGELKSCSGTWNTVSFKPYNFKSLGAPTGSGALHPRTDTYRSRMLRERLIWLTLAYSEQSEAGVPTDLL